MQSWTRLVFPLISGKGSQSQRKEKKILLISKVTQHANDMKRIPARFLCLVNKFEKVRISIGNSHLSWKLSSLFQDSCSSLETVFITEWPSLAYGKDQLVQNSYFLKSSCLSLGTSKCKYIRVTRQCRIMGERKS